MLCTALGIPPKNFNFEYVDKDKKYHLLKDLNPISFYQDLKIDLDEYASVIHAPTKDKPFMKNYTVAYLGNVVGGKLNYHLNLPMERVEELILAQLKAREVDSFG